VLDIALDASFDDAKAAYRRLAEIFHPDRFTDARSDIQTEAEKQMRYLNEAWKTIGSRLRDPAGDQHDDPLRDRTRSHIRDRFGQDVRDITREWAQDPTGDFGNRARHARTREKARTRSQQPSATDQTVDPDADRRDQFVRDARDRLAEEDAEAAEGERQAFVREARERLRTEQDQSA
jgi:curved DNA-binding protein CbpA